MGLKRTESAVESKTVLFKNVLSEFVFVLGPERAFVALEFGFGKVNDVGMDERVVFRCEDFVAMFTIEKFGRVPV